MPQSTWGFISDDVYEFLSETRSSIYELWDEVAKSMPTDTGLKYRVMDKLSAIEARINAAFAYEDNEQ